MQLITIHRASEGYPYMHLASDSRGRWVIVSEVTDPDDHDLLGHYVTADNRVWFMLREDGFDLDADFETHCDDIAEETRILVAEAWAEFG